MKVINLLQANKKQSATDTSRHLENLQNFRAISALEGLTTTPNHNQMLNDLASGKISKQDYIKARMKSI